jgi:hypothetical protein
MKSILKILTIMLLPSTLLGLQLNETITFNNYSDSLQNDLFDNFSILDESFTASPTGGIDGGSIIPKTYASWGNTRAEFKYTISAQVGSTIIVSSDFYYKQSLINPNQNQRPIGIFLSGNHSINTYIESSGILQISTYYWAASNWNSSNPTVAAELSLSDGWYRIELRIDVVGGDFGDEISIESEVSSLGLDGNDLPSSMGISSGTLYDTFFISDSSIDASIHATQWGGVERVDNFRIQAPSNDQLQTQVSRFEATIASAIEISWASQVDKIYTIEWSENLTSDSWNILSSEIWGDGTTMHFFDKVSNSRKFYRVKEQQSN